MSCRASQPEVREEHMAPWRAQHSLPRHWRAVYGDMCEASEVAQSSPRGQRGLAQGSPHGAFICSRLLPVPHPHVRTPTPQPPLYLAFLLCHLCVSFVRSIEQSWAICFGPTDTFSQSSCVPCCHLPPPCSCFWAQRPPRRPLTAAPAPLRRPPRPLAACPHWSAPRLGSVGWLRLRSAGAKEAQA